MAYQLGGRNRVSTRHGAAARGSHQGRLLRHKLLPEPAHSLRFELRIALSPRPKSGTLTPHPQL
eukprot:3377638-Rhodomonas_salina.1